MFKKSITVSDLNHYDKDQHLTLQNLIDCANKHNLDFNTCKIFSINVSDVDIDSGNVPIIEQNTGDNHTKEDYVVLPSLTVIEGNIYLTTF